MAATAGVAFVFILSAGSSALAHASGARVSPFPYGRFTLAGARFVAQVPGGGRPAAVGVARPGRVRPRSVLDRLALRA